MAIRDTAASVIGYLGKATSKGREYIGASIQDIKHYTGSGTADTQQGENVVCSEVMCMGHPSNTGKVWVRTGTTATSSNAWPLGASEVIKFNVDNLNELRMMIAVSGEKLIVAYA
jgi:hypothetical protein